MLKISKWELLLTPRLAAVIHNRFSCFKLKLRKQQPGACGLLEVMSEKVEGTNKNEALFLPRLWRKQQEHSAVIKSTCVFVF